MTSDDRFQPFDELMQQEGIPAIAIANFRHHYQQLLQGNTGFIRESDIQAVEELPDSTGLDEHYGRAGEAALQSTVLIKLNGGLGTSMGLDRAKSLIKVKQAACFLDIIAEHAIYSQVHLLFMNSFNTRADTLNLLQRYPALSHSTLAQDFLQHKVPKIRQADLAPALSTNNHQLEWCPPGHGDIYIALVSSGMLEKLIEAGYRYALISNSDNLGATLDTRLLGFMVNSNIPFLMEVTRRTEADKKGGHLARLGNGRYILRESAQCMGSDRDAFEDVERHRFFNTNNLWIDLHRLTASMELTQGILDLPLICNAKTLDPRDADSEPVYQLETAMGSAISIFTGASAIEVPRTRFAPVKTCNDLLLVRSDVFELQDNFTLTSRLSNDRMPLVNLDSRFYKLIDDFEARFPAGPPSLIDCSGLQLKGDIVFGKNISIRGKVVLENNSDRQVYIADNTVVSTNMNWK